MLVFLFASMNTIFIQLREIKKGDHVWFLKLGSLTNELSVLINSPVNVLTYPRHIPVVTGRFLSHSEAPVAAKSMLELPGLTVVPFTQVEILAFEWASVHPIVTFRKFRQRRTLTVAKILALENSGHQVPRLQRSPAYDALILVFMHRH